MIHPDLKTANLTLTGLKRTDRDFMLRQFSDPLVNRFLFDAEPLSSLEESDELITFYLDSETCHNKRYIIRDNTGQALGTLGFHCHDPKRRSIEIGYDLYPLFFGQGIMSEALPALLDYIWSALPVSTIEACIFPDNAASLRLAAKFGFAPTGERNLVFRGREYPHSLYSLMRY